MLNILVNTFVGSNPLSVAIGLGACGGGTPEPDEEFD